MVCNPSLNCGCLLLSFWVRLEWIEFAQASYLNETGEQIYAHPEMVKDGVALPNTHDSFYFGSIVQSKPRNASG